MLKKYAHQGCVQICEKSLGLSWMLKNKRRILCSAIIIIRRIATSDLMKICKDESYDPSPATTKVQGDRELPTISEHVLEKHQVKGFESNKKRMVRMYQTKDFQGFWICRRFVRQESGRWVLGADRRQEKLGPFNVSEETSIPHFSQGLNSFKAMRLLKRLLLKRQEALQYVRLQVTQNEERRQCPAQQMKMQRTLSAA